eukprot:GSChrysophyteH1.ASY1.ANO1.3273.1 assembled CDS
MQSTSTCNKGRNIRYSAANRRVIQTVSASEEAQITAASNKANENLHNNKIRGNQRGRKVGDMLDLSNAQVAKFTSQTSVDLRKNVHFIRHAQETKDKLSKLPITKAFHDHASKNKYRVPDCVKDM